MKQKFTLVICFVILSMFIWGCSNLSIKNTSTDLPQTVSSISPAHTETLIEAPTETPTETPTVTPIVTPTVMPTLTPTETPSDIFKAVLQNKVIINQKAYKGNYDEGITYQPFYLNDLINKIGIEQIGFDVDWNPYLNKFSILDMDGDKIPEIVIEIDSSCNGFYEVLHYYNGKVYGYYFVYRAMESLKADGTYAGSSGAADNSINKLSFSDSSLIENVLAYSEMADKYVIEDKIITSTEFESYCVKQNAKTDATWYEFNTNNIEKYFNNNTDNFVSASFSDTTDVYSYSIPKIDINSDDAKAINKEILDGYKPEIDEEIANFKQGLSVYMYSVQYDSFVNGNILSLVISCEFPDDCIDYQVYNVDVSTGKCISNTQLLQYKNITEADFLKILLKLYNDEFIMQNGTKDTDIENMKTAPAGFTEEEIKDFSEEYTDQYNMTIDKSNFGIDTPMFLDSDDNLNIIAKIYSLAGSDFYYHLIKVGK